MTKHLIARSISRPVHDWLFDPGVEPPSLRVLAVFEHACDLVTPDGRIVALVTPTVGDGPFNIVVAENAAGIFAPVEQGTTAGLHRGHLRIGPLDVALDRAVVWEPRPDWPALRDRRPLAEARLPDLSRIALQLAPAGSLLATASAGRDEPGHPAAAWRGQLPMLVSSAARRAARALRAGWNGDPDQLEAGARQLAGLGSGLTPAGDDFLTGVMLWAWLAHPHPSSFCHLLAETAAPRTTILSAALLRAAAAGQCSAPWHRLLIVLGDGAASAPELEPAARDVLAHGATSGADTLAGFLHLGSPPGPP